MSKNPDYYSIERVRFCYHKPTGQVQARIKLVGKALSVGITTGIICTLNEFKKSQAPNRQAEQMEFHQDLIKWNRSILQAACNLTRAGQTVTVERLEEARNLVPDDFMRLDESTDLCFQYLFSVCAGAAADEGEITARFRIGWQITPEPLPIGVKCSPQDWQVFSELRTTPESEELSRQLTAYQNAIINAARLFQRTGAELNPEVVHTAAMGPHNNGPYAQALAVAEL